MTTHNERIVEQFSLQAVPFTQVPGHSDSINMLIEFSGASQDSTVLDLACGPGIVACEFARHAKHVTGIDITPAMIEQAKKRQQENHLDNVEWKIGDVTALPFPDHSFSTVVTRYSFHHFENPKAVLAEMIRVCKPGGKVLVADVVLPADKVEKYDALELIRDPSHVHALTHSEMGEVFKTSSLKSIETANYKVEIELEQQIKASFPKGGDEDKIRKMFADELIEDRMGVNVHRRGNEIHYEVPITILVGTC
ncbi:class I SAM-dependent methyltransferase [Polynucleobacter sp. MWH-Creno-3A4]|jgi:ubiquinone/menaquinone biosynthesis C-methylase UbiE|uniref:class I SAM-dependent methyltransferase n=1 Tax=Polynucleobacter sp. MWH-Creno-3A4 TaxID=1855886 RepID=UPI001C0E8A96|nr:class I SAM-dependent methyltransferase [Polynucleobacter sp. MWH-Creno-3A4]MBU3605807.1 class I SAM-dependent methyltransferase [Polynucleobacter sp. MWH-Creno-3A4]